MMYGVQFDVIVHSSRDWTSLPAWHQRWSRFTVHLSALHQAVQFNRCRA